MADASDWAASSMEQPGDRRMRMTWYVVFIGVRPLAERREMNVSIARLLDFCIHRQGIG